MDATEQTISDLRARRGCSYITVYLDEEPGPKIPAIVARDLGLSVGMVTSQASLDSLIAGPCRKRALESALRSVAIRDRSAGEIRRKLSLAAYPEVAIEETIVRLLELGFLNDAAFAAKLVHNRLVGRGVGRRTIQTDLHRKGVSKETISEAMEAVDEDAERESARTAARSRMRALAGLPKQTASRKLASFLQRRGFTWDTISGVVEEALSEVEND